MGRPEAFLWEPHLRNGFTLVLLLSILVAIVTGTGTAHAQAEERAADQQRRMRLQLQQLQQQLSQSRDVADRAQAERGAMAAELDRLRAEDERRRGSATRQAARVNALDSELLAVRADRDRFESEASVARDEATAVQALLEQLAAQLSSEQGLRRQRETALQLTTTALELARAQTERDLRDNSSLLAINNELLDRLLNTSLWDRLKANEPFVQLRRVTLENLADDYRRRAAAARIEGRPGEPGAASVGGYNADQTSRP